MADLTIGYIGTRGAGEFDNTCTVIDNYDNGIRCICNVTPSTYDCDGAYMAGKIDWRIWKTNNLDSDATAMDEEAVEVVLSATQDAENLHLYIFDWADTHNDLRDVFVIFPLTYACDLGLIDDVLFENALAQARSIQIYTRGNNLREELLTEARERISIADTLEGLGYNVYDDETDN